MNKQIKVNVLAANIENAKRIVEAAKGDVYIGLMVKPYASAEEAAQAVEALQHEGVPVSVGLGAGDPAQWKKVAETAALTKPVHVNQVYPAAGYTKALLKAAGSEKTIVNALLKPGGTAGMVSALTGPESAVFGEAITCAAAAALLKETEIESVKFYPIGGDQHLDEVAAMVRAAVAAGITMFEPTGGIDAKTVDAVVKTCVENGAEIVVPHIYTAMVDPSTGLTDPEAVRALLARLRAMI